MSGLDDIGVKVIASSESVAGETGNVHPILHEIRARLEMLLATGEGSGIDLRSLPMSPQDYARLRDLLGLGEIGATLELLGPSEIRETAFPGVWWITHRNPGGDILAEVIEVTGIPEILKSQPADVQAGLARLREQLEADDEGTQC